MNSNKPGYFRTPAHFEPIPKALRELEDMSMAVDLLPNEVVCSACNLTYWQALGFCSNCSAWD